MSPINAKRIVPKANRNNSGIVPKKRLFNKNALTSEMIVPPTTPPSVLLGLISGIILVFPKSCPVIWLKLSKMDRIRKVSRIKSRSARLKKNNPAERIK